MPTYTVNTAFNGIDRVSNAFINMGRSAQKFRGMAESSFRGASKRGSMFGSIVGGNLVAGAVSRGFDIATGAVKGFFDTAMMIKDSEAAFTPLMGSASKASELVKRLNKEAATTPYEFAGISNIAKTLLPVMNGSIEDTANTFRMLGDTAGGKIDKLETITRGYTKALLKGKPDMEALNMIGEAGVPIFAEMAKTMGISTGQLFEMSKQGKLTNDDLTQTFKNMTSQGGIFFKGMEVASQTVSGKMSTLKDDFNLAGASLFIKLEPAIKSVINSSTQLVGVFSKWIETNGDLMASNLSNFVDSLVTGFKDLQPTLSLVFDIIKSVLPIAIKLAPAFLAWQAAILLVNLGLKGMAIVGIIGSMTQFIATALLIAKTEGIWAAAQSVLNAVMTANPIGLVIVGITALIGAGYLLVKNWETVKNFFIFMWGGIKTAFSVSVDFMTKALFTFADVILSTYGNIFKMIIKGAATVGRFIGLDVSGLDTLVKNIDTTQKDVRAKSFIGGSQEKQAPNAMTDEQRKAMRGEGTLTIRAEKGTEITGSNNGIKGVNLAFAGVN